MAEEQDSIRTVIVDDEAPARQLLCEYLAAHPAIEIVAECGDGFEAVKAVEALRPALLFLDIQMPKLDGFEVLELIGDTSRPAVIFVTAYDDYALRAFEVHALDYLLKPFQPARLAEALGRFGTPAPSSPPAAEIARTARPRGGYLERILVRDGAQIHVLASHRLDYIEAQDDYVAFFVAGGHWRKQQTLTQLEAELNPQRFVRIHRSYLLNIERLERLELYAKDSRLAILRGGARLPVSRAGYARLRTLL